jgi:HlyD family secretion protein
MKETMNASRVIGWIVRLALVAGLASAGWWAWNHWQPGTVRTVQDRYEFQEVTRGEIAQVVTASGTLNPVVLVNVGTQVSGTVRKLHADFNSKVEAGQVLLELDPTLFRAAVEQSSGAVATAEAALRLARANEARIRQLFEQEYVSRLELDQSVQAREAAEAQLRSARGQLARDEANLRFSTIRSPVSGVVVSRQVDVGQTVAASFQTPTLFRIAQDLTRMQIDTNVAEADIGRVKLGMPVRFTVDAFPGRRFEGTVSQVRLDPIVQQNVVSYDVVVAVANDDKVLMPGMTAYMSAEVDRRTDALLLPSAALRFRPKDLPPEPRQPPAKGEKRSPGGRVYVLRGQEIAATRIETGIANGRMVEVTGGELKEGDRVAVQNRLPDAPTGPSPLGAPAQRMRSF